MNAGTSPKSSGWRPHSSAKTQPTKPNMLHRAIELSREQGSNLWKLRSAIDLAELLRDQGQPHKARELLAPIHGWFSEGLDAPDLRRGSRLLETLG